MKRDPLPSGFDWAIVDDRQQGIFRVNRRVFVDQDVFEAAPGLELVLTAGVGSDHVDLRAAADRGILVAEQTGSNVVSVAEHAVMQLLALTRNYLPAYQQVVDGRSVEGSGRSGDDDHGRLFSGSSGINTTVALETH